MTLSIMEGLKFESSGLIPAIVQDRRTGEVLMMAYMNRDALEKTIRTGTSWFFSRSRQRLWNKGETSGNVQKVASIRVDCDMDTLLLLVDQVGVACHTGNRSCFFRDIEGKECDTKHNIESILEQLQGLVEERSKNPKEGSYTNYLLDKGIDKTLKKIGEEAAEVIIGAKNPGKEETIYEIADLLYHVTVLMHQKGIGYGEIYEELRLRRK
ncbi:MAG: bifunctional phosphoribosyl-AMP cyclohydrolase/phosphoribosyl-ATP diphosphatase HisIE [Bacillota bacterium]|jgi:phosphoribosyl-ATP pyrophosphohydrolase/phosphoribosyl-AMP cyclohydrolase|nr:bifunctional phosphoribosyl-AMP cyclohydrolase/phosphoribosyl-ATP diphosphatase HisIE [Bacillota bacterium]MDD3299107.1 bifunctional phosphoribosyl-AMP cyclohydrolase/phosphoribosyl-ATP diphosphatase HisIE [Bacillota bacterium]MDD3851129.1 bifunctional phosphoribosyl-AMP cyclohydrolase/phosphoribosyl-ATP diphosphatase HisIE [Bacillota bacterium]MDD4706946.1 bifunctional phosphoribosyl-AMP cyclohydrolase/phosphoribosyl-ATP diphosphatase HisIE [Bacillota bacterium]